MKRTFTQYFPRVTSLEYVDSRLRNAEFETRMHSNGEGALLEWYNKKYSLSLRFRIKALWSEPVKKIVGEGEVVISEKRTFSQETSKITVSSSIKTTLPFLQATITRIVEDHQDGCMETLMLEIDYLGDAFRDQITTDFFQSMARHIFPLNASERIIIPVYQRPSNGLFVPPKHSSQYLQMHSDLQAFRELSMSFVKSLDQTRILRKPIILPNLDQIGNICKIIDPSSVSIQSDIDEMRIEAERTQRLVNELCTIRSKATKSNSLPMFSFAACAAAIFIVLSRYK